MEKSIILIMDVCNAFNTSSRASNAAQQLNTLMLFGRDIEAVIDLMIPEMEAIYTL